MIQRKVSNTSFISILENMVQHKKFLVLQKYFFLLSIATVKRKFEVGNIIILDCNKEKITKINPHVNEVYNYLFLTMTPLPCRDL